MSSLEAQLQDRRKRLTLLREKKFRAAISHPNEDNTTDKIPVESVVNEVAGPLEEANNDGSDDRRPEEMNLEKATVRTLAYSFEREILEKQIERDEYKSDEDATAREKQLVNRVVREHRRSIQPALDELQRSTDRTIKRIVRKRYFEDTEKDNHESNNYEEGNGDSSV
ncbi:AaceriAEL256CAp [[Ashbya] aceris (nom. inval.)]|nr:AaceriAEL256CAp [[Ashbya] aceris (nom. inval.)]